MACRMPWSGGWAWSRLCSACGSTGAPSWTISSSISDRMCSVSIRRVIYPEQISPWYHTVRLYWHFCEILVYHIPVQYVSYRRWVAMKKYNHTHETLLFYSIYNRAKKFSYFFFFVFLGFFCFIFSCNWFVYTYEIRDWSENKLVESFLIGYFRFT